MTEINWSIYKSKFYGKERAAFESLAYMLFCYEFHIRKGIFRFKNQTGLETEPILIDGQYLGFQAKYYDTKIADNKDDIIDSLTKAKSKNPDLNKIILYTNQELSESSGKNKKKPTYQNDIEASAKANNIEIEWRVPSHFEKQLSAPENKHLAQHFFSLGLGTIDFLEKLKIHSENILLAIQTSINFGGQQIKIDRNDRLLELEGSKGQVIILSGDGGSGKTAIIKELSGKQTVPCYVFKASEFNNPNLTVIFNQFGSYDMADFLRFHDEEDKKFFVIDSAERLADLDSLDVFIEFLSVLIKDNWTIIFTTRNIYLDDLTFQMLEVYQRPFDIIKLENLSLFQLNQIAAKFQFRLPTSSRLLSLICNLFYLKEYLISYRSVSEQIDVPEFRQILWQKKIQNSKHRKDNAHLEREGCFLELAKERCNTGNFFLRGYKCSSKALSELIADEIIKHEPTQSGYFITHDIYEEWALEKLIENEYISLDSNSIFFTKIGDSLPIRRAFRGWLSGKLYQSSADIRHFIEKTFNSNDVPEFWKDELLVSVLLSDYCSTFFRTLDKMLLDNEKYLLKKIIFLLRTACKEVDQALHSVLHKVNGEPVNPGYVFTMPKGNGWIAAIEYIHFKIAFIKIGELDIILSFLEDWINHNRKGATTRLAGLIALHFYKDAELNKDTYYDSEIEKNLLHLVLLAAAELKPELKAITDQLIGAPTDRGEAFGGLREAILTNNDDNIAYLAMLPEDAIKMASNSWFQNKIEKHPYYSDGIGMESHYSIRRNSHHDYFPASALQTPIYLLLRFAFPQTIDFIIEFTNKTAEAYFASGYDSSVEEIEVTFGTKKTKQIISNGLWNMYRGSGSPVTPYLLQSIHMALEKRLLEVAKASDNTTLQEWLIYLLENTRSVSITAVVTSIVLAYPDKLFDVAKILFRNYEFVQCDNIRLVSENEAKSIASIGAGLDHRTKRFEEERIETCKEPHRNLSLESLAVNYQFFRNEDVSEEQAEGRKNEVWKAIDYIHSTLPRDDSDDEEQKKIRLLLTRIDRRKMNPVFEQEENKLIINLNPELDEDLQTFSQDGMAARQKITKYLSLKHWAVDKVAGLSRYGPYAQYDENPELVAKETREICEGLHTGTEEFYMFNSSTPAYACAALIRYYSDQLPEDDILFCKDVITSYAVAPLRENYRYQIADGVEAAVNALPFLYKKFPDLKHDCNVTLLLVLFDGYPLGNYKRICDYAIEALDDLFRISPSDANAVLFGFISLKPKFDAENSRDRGMLERKSRGEIVAEFVTKYGEELNAITHDTGYYNSIEFATQSMQVSETAFQIIPSDTCDPRHLDYVRKLLSKFSKELFSKTRYSDSKSGTDFSLKHRFFKKLAVFLLHREAGTIDQWAKPVIQGFRLTKEMGDFLSEVVSAEDNLGKYESFWALWDCFYPTIKAWAQESRAWDLNTIISNYLLAWQWWPKETKEWRSLRERETVFFKKVCSEMGQHPAVLYSISKLLNEIGSSFIDEGIFWIADMLLENKNLSTEELRPNTIYYLEVIARKYVYLNRTKIKKHRALKENVLILLNFLVAKGSVNGYLLREEVL